MELHLRQLRQAVVGERHAVHKHSTDHIPAASSAHASPSATQLARSCRSCERGRRPSSTGGPRTSPLHRQVLSNRHTPQAQPPVGSSALPPLHHPTAHHSASGRTNLASSTKVLHSAAPGCCAHRAVPDRAVRRTAHGACPRTRGRTPAATACRRGWRPPGQSGAQPQSSCRRSWRVALAGMAAKTGC